jgi:hypothetical protein
MTSRFFFLLLLALPACAPRPLEIVNPTNNSPTILASAGDVAVWGGGSATARRWGRRALVSLTVRNNRPRAITLARKDLVMHLGFRRRAARTLVGSAVSGPVEAITIPSKDKRELFAEFSAVLGLRRRGTIVLRFVEEGTGEVVRVEVPFRMQRAKAL